MKKLGLAACAAFALTATGASAGGYWQNGTYYSYSDQGYSTTYNDPGTSVVGSVGPVQSVSPQTYVQPGYGYQTQTYGTQSYTAPSYGTQTYTVPTYSAPTYTVPSYSAPTYTTPSYATTPSYTVPSYAPSYGVPSYTPRYDGRDRVRERIQRQRSRIERAEARGDLRRGEERRLREGLREIRYTMRAWRKNDGVIDHAEEAELMRMLDRNSRRIRRLANNDRVRGHHGHNGYHYSY